MRRCRPAVIGTGPKPSSARRAAIARRSTEIKSPRHAGSLPKTLPRLTLMPCRRARKRPSGLRNAGAIAAGTRITTGIDRFGAEHGYALRGVRPLNRACAAARLHRREQIGVVVLRRVHAG